jgi:hypothetical protein
MARVRVFADAARWEFHLLRRRRPGGGEHGWSGELWRPGWSGCRSEERRGALSV